MCHMHMIFCTVEAKRRQCLMHVAYMLSLVGRRQQRRKRIALARFRQHPVPLAARLPHVATHGGAGQPARRDFVEPASLLFWRIPHRVMPRAGWWTAQAPLAVEIVRRAGVGHTGRQTTPSARTGRTAAC